MIDVLTRQLVRARAGERCEYCQIAESDQWQVRLQIEHIIPRKHGGPDSVSNLALACQYCNLHKGPNLAGLDPDGGALVRLYNPRTDPWEQHFAVNDDRISGLTDIGRTTVFVLEMNSERRRNIRRVLRGISGEEEDG